MIEISLVIPCYNESKNLPTLISRCREVFVGKTVEIILVDNGSSDETPQVLSSELINETFIRSIRVEVNQGYGYGILSGLKEAKGRYIGWTHADLQTDPADVLKAFDSIHWNMGGQIFIKGQRHGRPFSDVLFTVGMSIFESLILKTRLWDINAQPTLFPKVFFENWKNPPYDFSLDLYAYYKAKEAGLKIHRFPVYFGKRLHGTSHWNINWKAKMKFIKRTLEFSFRLRNSLREV